MTTMADVTTGYGGQDNRQSHQEGSRIGRRYIFAGFWNVRSWSVNSSMDNNILRSSCVSNSCLDIVGIAETHLLSNNVLYLEGNTWFGYNRMNTHKTLESVQFVHIPKIMAHHLFLAILIAVAATLRTLLLVSMALDLGMLLTFRKTTLAKGLLNSRLLRYVYAKWNINTFTSFTSVSTKCSSVVDYCIVPLDELSKFFNFKVIFPFELTLLN